MTEAKRQAHREDRGGKGLEMGPEHTSSGSIDSFRIGDRLVTPALNEIDGVRVESKAMEVLMVLAEAAPNVASSATVLKRVWPDVVVIDNVVYQAVAQLRKAMGDDARAPRYIETLPRRGYRLVSPITTMPHDLPAQSLSAARTQSILVLPLSNVSADPDQVHFVDGLTIELIHRLSRIPNLRVAGQASSFAYKDRLINYADIGRMHGIANLLGGSVRKMGDRLRVTVELVSTADGFQLWSADFDRRLDDLFAIQREISDAVADSLSVTLRCDSLELLGSTSNATAHSHYLRGNALFWQHTIETTERAISELEEAVAIDPCFARAWVVLSLAHGARARRPEHTERSLRDMANAVERALQSEPLLWRAHAARCWYLLSRRQFAAAHAAMSEARRLRCGQESIVGPDVMNYLHQIGRWTERLKEGERFQSSDPALGANHDALYVLGRRAEAARAFARLKGLSQSADREYLVMLAMDQPSAEAADRIIEGFSKSPLGLGWFGPSDKVLPALRRILAAGNSFRGDFAFDAMIAARHGDLSLAVDFLRAGYLVDGFGAFHLLWFPQLALVRKTAEFKAILIELGLADMWRHAGCWGDFCEPVGDYDFRCH